MSQHLGHFCRSFFSVGRLFGAAKQTAGYETQGDSASVINSRYMKANRTPLLSGDCQLMRRARDSGK